MRILFLSSVVTMLLSIAMVAGPSLAQTGDEPVPLAVIAHGVTARPDGEVAWRVRPRRAPLPERGRGIARPASFVLAEGGPIAIVALSGKVQSRLSPGEAVWMPPGLPAAVVSLDDLPVGYAQIELAPATELSGADWELATDSFTLPRAEDAFALKLARGVVRLRGVLSVDAGITPGLLYVTSGIVGVEAGDGERVQLTAGSVLEVEGEVQLFGGSRQPATFVLASVAAAAPVKLPLLNGVQPTVAPVATATPTVAAMPTATPRPRPTIAPIATATVTPSPTPLPTPTAVPEGEAAVALTAAICPVAYEGSDYQADCLSPASDVEFIVSMGDDVVRSEVADAAGEVAFDALPAGDYVIAAGVPGDFASSRVRCLDATGVDIARRAATNQVAVSLVPDDAISCDWFIVPEDARGETGNPAATVDGPSDAAEATPTPPPVELIGSVSVHIRACPPGMSVETLDPDACDLPPAGTSISLLADNVPQGVFEVGPELWWWQNLPLRSFSLVVNALPEGFAASSLGSRVCCEAGDAFEVYTSAETPDTGYILFLYPTPGAEQPMDEADIAPTATPEAPLDPLLAVDPDGDGVPTVDEDGFFGTDPQQIDTDGDGVSDTTEIAAGADPLEADATGP